MTEETADVQIIDEDEQDHKYLTFFIGQDVYGIDIRRVTEIIGIQPITKVPGVPKYVKGIINLRGKIIPVIDVRLKFNKEFFSYNDRTCVIVVEKDDIILGMIVDGVAEVLIIPEANIVSPPEMKNSSNNFIKAIGKVGDEVKMLLDCDKIFNETKE